MSIPDRVNMINGVLADKTKKFVETKLGKLFLMGVLLGPFTFIPTVYVVWTAPNIDSFRTATWPLMIIVNISGLLGVIHDGNWQMRIVLVLWIVMMLAVYVAILVR